MNLLLLKMQKFEFGKGLKANMLLLFPASLLHFSISTIAPSLVEEQDKNYD